MAKTNLSSKKRRNVQIHPDYICNNNCRFCITGNLKTKRYLSTSEIIKRLDNLNIDKNTYVTLVGGEATIRPDIIELISYISKKGGNPCLFSNGRQFAYPDFALKALKAGLREVRISVYAHDAKLHDWLTRTNGSFKQTLQGVENLLNLRDKYNFPLMLELKTLICKPVVPHLIDTINLFCKKFPNLGEGGIGIYGMAFRGNVSENIDEMAIRLSEAKEYIKKAINLAVSFKQNIRLIDIPPCILGDLKYATYYQMTDISELQVTDRKESVKLKSSHERTKGPLCKYCKFNSTCSGVWIYYAKIYGTDELIPFR